MASGVSRSTNDRFSPAGKLKYKLASYEKMGDIRHWEYHWSDDEKQPGVFIIKDFWNKTHVMSLNETRYFILGMACVFANTVENED